MQFGDDLRFHVCIGDFNCACSCACICAIMFWIVLWMVFGIRSTVCSSRSCLSSILSNFSVIACSLAHSMARLLGAGPVAFAVLGLSAICGSSSVIWSCFFPCAAPCCCGRCYYCCCCNSAVRVPRFSRISLILASRSDIFCLSIEFSFLSDLTA